MKNLTIKSLMKQMFPALPFKMLMFLMVVSFEGLEVVGSYHLSSREKNAVK